MYEAFYGFREKPFNLTPDPKFLYLSGKHHEAFAHLEFGLRQRGGFIVVTGEVGTGKTTLCRYFLERLDENTVSAFILYPALGTTELLRAINHDLGVPYDGKTDKELIDGLHQFLLESRARGKNIVLVIDESQNLSRDVLEQVRMISNLETHTEKLIQIVLIGQSELNDLLAQSDLRQLAQRITARYHLNPLSRGEMTLYIRHRLAVAGGLGQVDFTERALWLIHRFSGGIPRLINLLCDRALLAGYVLDRNLIGGSVVRRAMKELDGGTGRAKRRRWTGAALWLGATALLAMAAGFWMSTLSPSLSARSRLSALFSAPSAPASAATFRDVAIPPGEAAEMFELRLGTLSEELSQRAAAAVLLERWGVPLSDDIASIEQLEDMPKLASRSALQYTELDTTFDQLLALDLPAVLEVRHPSRRTSLYLALTSLDRDTATVYFSPGDFFRIPTSLLERFWSGKARLFWRDFDSLETSDVPKRLAWTRARLRTLGMLAKTETAPEKVQAAVRELQKKLLLVPDGNVGHETRMALYSLGGDYSVPRLGRP